MLQCHICSKPQNSLNGLAKHIFNSHKDISRKEYYDKYIAEISPVCVCGKEKKFRTLGEGYRTYCCNRCYSDNSPPTSYWTGKKQPQTMIDKRQATILKNHGVTNGFLVKPSRAITYKGFVTRSSYERNFINFSESYGYTLTVPKRIPFDYNGTKRHFHPDFYIKELDLIVEVKSQWTWNQNLELNKAKLVFTLGQGHHIVFIDETHGINDSDRWDKLNEYLLSRRRPD